MIPPQCENDKPRITLPNHIVESDGIYATQLQRPSTRVMGCVNFYRVRVDEGDPSRLRRGNACNCAQLPHTQTRVFRILPIVVPQLPETHA